ncbi:hypothetical protein BDA99DRAFT_501446 [Phascolomyces articulosus]|uniref:Uncharacterized protein n=1 Tax=Phascolomyces articulosus TaxID=60185 RepID=A0AAD5PIY8_9FUNG|nr:hypothetical protein BDA99DRAFT_501446 [Phascolomyces articulosus]
MDRLTPNNGMRFSFLHKWAFLSQYGLKRTDSSSFLVSFFFIVCLYTYFLHKQQIFCRSRVSSYFMERDIILPWLNFEFIKIKGTVVILLLSILYILLHLF